MIVRRLQSSDAAIYQQIRRCALKDVPQFVGPLAEQEAVSDLSELCSRMERYESEGIFPFGCFLDGECAGVASLSRKLNPKYSHKVFFWGLYVLPAHRGRSVGRQLMEHRIAFARELPGVRFATLQVTTTNKPARILDQRFGFLSCGIEPQALHLDGKFYDFELMQLDLSDLDRQAKSTTEFRIHG
jgi:ribosomal protein S18 acetylase RimI-like enzyme